MKTNFSDLINRLDNFAIDPSRIHSAGKRFKKIMDEKKKYKSYKSKESETGKPDWKGRAESLYHDYLNEKSNTKDKEWNKQIKAAIAMYEYLIVNEDSTTIDFKKYVEKFNY